MEEAKVDAKAARVNGAASYMMEPSTLKGRGEKQLEARTMLTSALASLSVSKMRGAERLGLDWIGSSDRFPSLVFSLFFCQAN